MEIELTACRIAQKYQSVSNSYVLSRPEVTNNGYSYFNYDKRVIEERVPRGDVKIPYYTAKDISDMDYEELIRNAFSRMSPILMKYSKNVAFEDALSTAIRDHRNGFYDGKINANMYNVLLEAMAKTPVVQVVKMAEEEVEAKGRKRERKQERFLTPDMLKRLRLKREDVPYPGGPRSKELLVKKERGKVKLEPRKESSEENNLRRSEMDVKAFTEKLDKIATDVEAFSPELAMEIDKVSDVLEGRKEASSLKYDADEARYMADRMNNKVRKRDADEPYMDQFNDNDFSQVSNAYDKMPGHSGKGAVAPAGPAAAPAPVPEKEEAKEAEKPAEKPEEKPAEEPKEEVKTASKPYQKR
jgi:hypothetical protein